MHYIFLTTSWPIIQTWWSQTTWSHISINHQKLNTQYQEKSNKEWINCSKQDKRRQALKLFLWYLSATKLGHICSWSASKGLNWALFIIYQDILHKIILTLHNNVSLNCSVFIDCCNFSLFRLLKWRLWIRGKKC